MPKKKRGPKPNKRNEVILNLRDKKIATSAELGVQTSFMFTLMQHDLVTRAGSAPTGGKGRPKIVWKLTAKGNGKGLSLSRKISAEKIAA